MKLEHLRVDFTHIASHPSRGAWIEILTIICLLTSRGSHPSRGAWIEIYRGRSISTMMDVAPLTGCVD